ncbi:MAG: hypothetical protein HYV93_08645 [Candidatus Rokubacteria bacterium]|nr:hypothetical protein [Candidatus Rokubacteria bacterium]
MGSTRSTLARSIRAVSIQIASPLLPLGLVTLALARERTALPAPTALPVPTAPPLPQVPDDAIAGGAVAIPLVLLILAVVLAVRLVDLRRQRAHEAGQLEARIAEALATEGALAGLPVTPRVRVPLWSDEPVVEVTGQVPAPEIEAAALRVVEREASAVASGVRVEDHLRVVRAPRAA